jgi:ketosteroid isomerase-like protein
VNHKLFHSVVYLVFSIWIISCDHSGVISNKDAELQEISRTIDSCIGWFKHKDFDLLFSVVARDSNFLEVHPTDRVVRGFGQFRNNCEIFKNPDFQYSRHEIKNLQITLSQSGENAWFYCVLNDINTWKGQPANWENTRWTGVLEKREGRWVIVQQHFSFAAR